MKVGVAPPKIGFLRKIVQKSFAEHFARQFLFEKLKKIRTGQITILEKGKIYKFGETTHAFPLKTTIRAYHPRFYARILLGGSIGAAEAYMDGLWSTEDLTTVIRILIRHQSVFEEMEKGWAKLTSLVHRVCHAFHRNTLQGSPANIIAHYDLGNDFYQLFLDKTMTYSCGIFEQDQCSMEEASLAKYRRICHICGQTLRLPRDHNNHLSRAI